MTNWLRIKKAIAFKTCLLFDTNTDSKWLLLVISSLIKIFIVKQRNTILIHINNGLNGVTMYLPLYYHVGVFNLQARQPKYKSFSSDKFFGWRAS